MKKKTIRYDKISTYFYLNKKSFILASITGIIYNVLMVFVPIVQGKLLDEYVNEKESKYIIIFALSFFVFVLLIQINRFFKRYYVRDFANKMVLTMRKVSFHSLLMKDMNFFENNSKGDLMNKNLSDIKDSAEGVRKILTEVYDTLILMFGYIISMFIQDYILTLIVLCFVVASVSFANLLKKLIYKTTSEYKKTFSANKDIILNCIENEQYYRGEGCSSRYYQKYKVEQDLLEKKSIKALIYKSSLEPIYKAISLFGLFFIVYYGGKKYLDGTFLIGTFSSFLSTYILLSVKAAKTGKLFNAATTMKVSWKRCLPFLNSYNEMENFEIDEDKPSIIVNHLTFGFDESFKVKDISFNLKKGETLAIAGMIHSGKSTLGAALSGLYDYKGSICLYGVELNKVKDKINSSFISYAPSKVEIFNETIKYNISFSNESDVSKELSLTYLNEDISSFEKKENEILSHSCSNLSGGQQKRLQIARAIYNSPKLIILDDPFNAIDINMSERIFSNIKINYPSSMLIVINNQKEILKKVDKILFLKNDSYIFSTYNDLLKDSSFALLMGENK